MRICPGERPVPIFKKTDSNHDENEDMHDQGANHFLSPQRPPMGGFEGIDSIINSIFGGEIMNENNDPFGAFFGHHHGGDRGVFGGESGDIFGGAQHRRPPPSPGLTGRHGDDIPALGDSRDKMTQSVLQPPHSIPKGTSPSVRQYGASKNRLQGEAVSPPENI